MRRKVDLGMPTECGEWNARLAKQGLLSDGLRSSPRFEAKQAKVGLTRRNWTTILKLFIFITLVNSSSGSGDFDHGKTRIRLPKIDGGRLWKIPLITESWWLVILLLKEYNMLAS